MQLHKFETLRFIFKGKQYRYRIIFSNYMYDIVPIYYSHDILNIKLLTFEDNSSVILLNEEYIKSITKENVEIEILYLILNKLFKEKVIVDLHLANWIGYRKTIEFLHSKNVKGNKERIEKLESMLMNTLNISIQDRENVVNQLKYIEVIYN